MNSWKAGHNVDVGHRSAGHGARTQHGDRAANLVLERALSYRDEMAKAYSHERDFVSRTDLYKWTKTRYADPE